MRDLLAPLGAALLLAGCYSGSMMQDTPGSSQGWNTTWGTAEPVSIADKTARWEQEWAQAKTQVVEARTNAAASGRDIPPEVEEEVTELLNRDLSGPSDDAVRLQRLQDSVSDARRLAELVSTG